MALSVDANKSFAPLLVETSANIIESLWSQVPPHLPQLPAPVLRKFIAELLLRSKASYSTVYLSLLYLFRLKPTLGATLGQYPSQNMFLAALVLASKFLQDSCYSNRSWAKLTGIPATEITLMERLLLRLLDHSLHVKEAEFDAWSQFVTMHMAKLHARSTQAQQQHAHAHAETTTTMQSQQQQTTTREVHNVVNSPALSATSETTETPSSKVSVGRKRRSSGLEEEEDQEASTLMTMVKRNRSMVTVS